MSDVKRGDLHGGCTCEYPYEPYIWSGHHPNCDVEAGPRDVPALAADGGDWLDEPRPVCVRCDRYDVLTDGLCRRCAR